MARGHIYRRRLKGGGWSSWHAVIDLARVEAGNRRQVTRSFGTRREAQAWLARQVQDRESRDSGVLLVDYLGQWLPQQRQLRHSTRVSYETHIRKYLVPELGDRTVDAVTRVEIEKAHDTWRGRGVSGSLIRRINSTLSSALSCAVREGLVAVNPAARIRFETVEAFTATVWSQQEAARFLACAQEDELTALWRLALVTGLRRAELLGLRWCNVDLEAGHLMVRNTRAEVAGRMVDGPPKSRRGRRCVVLDRGTLEALGNYHRICAVRALAQGHALAGDWLVFVVDGSGRGVTPDLLMRRFRQLTASSDLPRIRFHDLRHTSATLGLASGETLKEVSARLGHSSVATTGDLYVQVRRPYAAGTAGRVPQTDRRLGACRGARQSPRACRRGVDRFPVPRHSRDGTPMLPGGSR